MITSILDSIIEKSKPLPNSNFVSESAKIKCVCDNIIVISSIPCGDGEIKCFRCDLTYKFWNNKDGSGLKAIVRGYPPFFENNEKGQKFILKRS